MYNVYCIMYIIVVIHSCGVITKKCTKFPTKVEVCFCEYVAQYACIPSKSVLP